MHRLITVSVIEDIQRNCINMEPHFSLSVLNWKRSLSDLSFCFACALSNLCAFRLLRKNGLVWTSNFLWAFYRKSVSFCRKINRSTRFFGTIFFYGRGRVEAARFKKALRGRKSEQKNSSRSPLAIWFNPLPRTNALERLTPVDFQQQNFSNNCSVVFHHKSPVVLCFLLSWVDG